MSPNRLIRLVVQSIRRNRRDFLLSSIGIIIGIGTLLFFTALGAGVQTTVLERVFVVRQLEVVKPSYDLAGFQTEGLFGGPKLNDRTAEIFGNVDGVAGVFPKMKLVFPSSVKAGKALLGKDMWAELIADGIPPGLVTAELEAPPFEFKDWEAIPCDAGCPSGMSCGSADICVGSSCASDADCGDGMYCHADDKQCLMPVPVIISPALLEIYNGSVQTAMSGAKGMVGKLPKLSERSLVGFEGEAVFGRSYMGQSKSDKRVTRRVKLVGFSTKAINLGVTMPIGYVKRLNAEIAGMESGGEYHAIVVEAVSNDAVPMVAQTITTDLGYALSSKYENAQRAGLLILLITLIFNLVSLIFLGIAAINIMHTFLMIILERRRELALMRALGATSGNIRMLVLGEATALGLVGGTIGVLLGYSVSLVVDYLLATQVSDFPYKPETLFVFAPWMWFGAFGVALLFCWIGALIPAVRASRMDPAGVLAGR